MLAGCDIIRSDHQVLPTVSPSGQYAVFATVNPVTYLVEGLRASLGVQVASTSTLLLLAVPLGWIALSTAVASRRLRWDVTR